MGFADAYLLKAGLREPLIQTDPHSDLKIIVTIPVNNESGLLTSLDSLYKAAAPIQPAAPIHTAAPIRAEVLILVNAAADAPPAVHEQNLITLSQAEAWISEHPHPFMDFHIWLDHSFGKKEAGVGMARKLIMDEAARRFSAIKNSAGIIAGFDADAEVDSNYIQALADHFSLDADLADPLTRPDGCSIYFEHPLQGDSFSPAVYNAITHYELHLRYYLAAMRSTGHPDAYHTVGSSFAVRADVYCMEGGMNRRKGGEDFYFIQKVAQRGNWSECKSTRVIPSPRSSDRVPFGTGRAVQELLREADSSGGIPTLTSYNPAPFGMLQQLFSNIDSLYSSPGHDTAGSEAPDNGSPAGPGDLPGVPYINRETEINEVLSEFLSTQSFEEALEEILSNTGSLEAFRKRFWRWFNMFRIMKFLHYARDHGFPDVRIGEAVHSFLSFESPRSNRELLEIFRNRER